MKGIIFNAVESAVTELMSADAWDDILEKAAVDGQYTAIGNYDDDELRAIVGAAAEVTGWSPDEVLRVVGRTAFQYLAGRYPELLDGVDTTEELLRALNQIIHPEVLKLYPDANPPHFEIETLGDNTLRVTYVSERQMSALAEGLLHGGADRLGEEIVISPVASETGSTTFDIQISKMAVVDG